MLGTVEIHANALKSRMHKCLSIIHACTTILTTDATNLITDAKIIHQLYAPSNSMYAPMLHPVPFQLRYNITPILLLPIEHRMRI